MDIERPIRSCDHKIQHHHGTRVAYRACGCTCDDCAEAHRAYERNRKRLVRRGGERKPIDKVQAHIHTLKSHGMSPKLIAERCGVHPTTIQRLDRGIAEFVTSGSEKMILAVEPENTAPRSNQVPATGSIRRLRHLALQGWSTKDIAAVSNLSYRNLQDILREDREYLTEENAREIKAATRALMGRTPPPGRVAAYVTTMATRKGWVSMFAYDDLDDPNETPNVTHLKRKSRDEAAYDRLDDLEHLVNSGVSAEEAAVRAGYPNAKAAYSAAQHKGLRHLSDALIPAVAEEARHRNSAA